MARILIIDDEEMMLTILTEFLSSDAHQVIPAHNGEEGLRLIRQSRPDLIITDILMPHKDGIDLIMELLHEHSDIPVIAMSGGRRAVTSRFNLESATLLGVKSTLLKPFSKADLRAAMRQAFA